MNTLRKTLRKTNRINKKKKYTKRKRRLYRKRRGDIQIMPGSKGIPLFSVPIHNEPNNITLFKNKPKNIVNIIDGLRNM